MNRYIEKLFYKKMETMEKIIAKTARELKHRVLMLSKEEGTEIYAFEFEREILSKLFEDTDISVRVHQEIVNNTEYIEIKYNSTTVFAYNIVPERCIIKCIYNGSWIDIIIQHELRGLGIFKIRIYEDNLTIKTYMS